MRTIKRLTGLAMCAALVSPLAAQNKACGPQDRVNLIALYQTIDSPHLQKMTEEQLQAVLMTALACSDDTARAFGSSIGNAPKSELVFTLEYQHIALMTLAEIGSRASEMNLACQEKLRSHQ
jgi:hypothetical protein